MMVNKQTKKKQIDCHAPRVVRTDDVGFRPNWTKNRGLDWRLEKVEKKVNSEESPSITWLACHEISFFSCFLSSWSFLWFSLSLFSSLSQSRGLQISCRLLNSTSIEMNWSRSPDERQEWDYPLKYHRDRSIGRIIGCNHTQHPAGCTLYWHAGSVSFHTPCPDENQRINRINRSVSSLTERQPPSI